MPVVDDCMLFPIDSGLDETVDGFDEVVAVELCVEAEDAAAEHSCQQLIPPWTDPESLEVGPGDMPEAEDGGPRKALADHPRQQREVVVLDENDGIVRFDFVAHGFGELAVHRDVLPPVLATEDGPGVSDMAQRPEAFV